MTQAEALAKAMKAGGGVLSMSNLNVETAQSWKYKWGIATVQLIRGDDVDSPCRLWNGQPQYWWTIPRHTAYKDMAEKVYNNMVTDEEYCHSSWERQGDGPSV